MPSSPFVRKYSLNNGFYVQSLINSKSIRWSFTFENFFKDWQNQTAQSLFWKKWIGYKIVQIGKLLRVSNISASKVLLCRQYMSMVASNLRSDDAWDGSRKELFIEYQWRWEMRIPVNQAIVSLTSLHGELLSDLISYPLLVIIIGFQMCVAF